MVYLLSNIKGSRMNIKWSVTDLWSLIFDHGPSVLWSFILDPQSYRLQIWLILDQRSKDRGWTSKDQWQIFDQLSLIMISDHGPSILWSFILGRLSYGLHGIWLIFDQRSKNRGWKIKWLIIAWKIKELIIKRSYDHGSKIKGSLI